MVPARHPGESAYHRRCMQGVFIKASGGLCVLALAHEVLSLTDHLQTQPVDLGCKSAKASIQRTAFPSSGWETQTAEEQGDTGRRPMCAPNILHVVKATAWKAAGVNDREEGNATVAVPRHHVS